MTPLNLRSVNPDLYRSINHVAQFTFNRSWQLYESYYIFELTYNPFQESKPTITSSTGTPEVDGDDITYLSLKIGNVSLDVDLIDMPAHMCSLKMAIGNHWSAMPKKLKEAIVNGLLQDVATLLQRKGHNSVSWAFREVDVPKKAFEVGIVHIDSGHFMKPAARISTSAKHMMRLGRLIEGIRFRSTPWEWLAIPSQLILAEIDIELDRLRALKFGDVIVIGQAKAASEQINATLVIGRTLKVTVLLEAEMAKVMGTMEMTSERSDERNFSPDTDVIDHVSEIVISVRFVIADLNISVKSITEFVPGYVVELPINAEKELRIYAGSQLIGRGELVGIGSSLGVLITKVPSELNSPKV